MTPCTHPPHNRLPVCLACYRALPDKERHELCIEIEARAQGLPVPKRAAVQGELIERGDRALEAL